MQSFSAIAPQNSTKLTPFFYNCQPAPAIIYINQSLEIANKELIKFLKNNSMENFSIRE